MIEEMPVTQIHHYTIIAFLDMLSISLFIPYMSQFGRLLGSSPKWTGAAASLYGLFQIISSPIMGRLSDVFGRSLMMVICYLVTGTGYFYLTVTSSYLGFITVRFISGLFKHGITLCKVSITDITQRRNKNELSYHIGRFTACVALGSAIGVIIGGQMAKYDPTFHSSLIVTTIIYIGLSLYPIFIISNKAIIPANHNSEIKNILPRWWLISIYWDILLTRLFQQISELCYYSTLPLVLEEGFNFKLDKSGFILGFNSFCGIISAYYTDKILKRVFNGNSVYMAKSVIVYSIVSYIMVLTLDIRLLFFGLFGIEASAMIFRLAHINLVMERTSEEDRGLAFGLIQSISSISKIISPVMSGFLYEHNIKFPISISIVFSIICLVNLFIVDRRKHASQNNNNNNNNNNDNDNNNNNSNSNNNNNNNNSNNNNNNNTLDESVIQT